MMEKIDTDYKQWTWKIEAERFKPFNRDYVPLESELEYTRTCLHTSWERSSFHLFDQIK